MALSELRRRLGSRVYEVALRAGATRYRLPFQDYDAAKWERSYATDALDVYEGLAERPRYGVLTSYLRLIDGPLDILDVGCGTGILRGHIPDEKVRSYLGTDTAPAAIARATARGFARTEFRAAPIPDQGSFDVVIANEMLYFVEDVTALLDEAKRRLRPGGLFLTSNTRFAGDFWLRERIAERFTLLTESIVVAVNPRIKWRIGCYRA